MSEQTEHLIRTALLAVVFLALGAARLLGLLPPDLSAEATGMLAVLGPGLLDSVRHLFKVKKRLRAESSSGNGA